METTFAIPTGTDSRHYRSMDQHGNRCLLQKWRQEKCQLGLIKGTCGCHRHLSIQVQSELVTGSEEEISTAFITVSLFYGYLNFVWIPVSACLISPTLLRPPAIYLELR